VPVLAEERASREGLGRPKVADAFLLVDPVDGTKEFVQRKGDFTVNIALICGGKPMAGASTRPPAARCISAARRRTDRGISPRANGPRAAS
jgi:3'(2'), 5'-bisphosphate nucleotidase